MIVYVSSVSEFPKNFLEHILSYYTSKGVDKFFFTVYSGKGSNAWKELEEAKKRYNVEFYSNHQNWSPYCDAQFKNFIRFTLEKTDFLIPADTDEFHYHPNFPSFPFLAAEMDKEGADYVKTELIDRITEDGSIPSEIQTTPLTEQFPRTCFISKNIMKCYTVKMAMTRATVDIWSGHHILEAHKNLKPLSTEAKTDHYKWFGDVIAKETKKIMMYKSLNVEWYHEQERLYEHLASNGGKL